MSTVITGPVTVSRGLKSSLDNLAGDNLLVPFAIYFTTDTHFFYIATSSSTYEEFLNSSNINSFRFSDVIPLNPINGDRCINPDDGILYTYVQNPEPILSNNEISEDSDIGTIVGTFSQNSGTWVEL